MIDKINLLDEADNTVSLFEYRYLGSLNGHMLNIILAENRTLDFHIHETSDELFYVIDGEMDIEFEDGLQHLSKNEMIIIPSGTLHRPVVTSLVKCLLVEKEGALNSENTGGTY